MRKKIRLSMFIVAFGTAIFTTIDAETIYYLLYKKQMQQSAWLDLVLFFLTIAFIAIISVIVSKWLVPRIVNPVEDMAEHLDDTTYEPKYEELVPIMNRIRRQHEQIMAAARTRQDFSANVSHELKTPLTAISGYAELMENGMVSEAEQKHFASEIKRNSDRLLSIINDIISLSELDQVGEMTMEALDLYDLVQDTMEPLQMVAKNAHVNLEFEGEHVSVYGSKENLRQVVFNLVQNAIKYNNEGGHVWVSVYTDSSVILSIKDDGIGIPVEDQEKIFERFYRVDKSRSRNTGGTGLGLSIVKHIVELHNARILLDSEVGHGTEIKVVF